MKILREIHKDYPKIQFQLHSGNAEDVMERLDKGLLDFGVLIQPVDISKYASLSLPVRDVWGIVTRKDHPLARKRTIQPVDLEGEPLIVSRNMIGQGRVGNPYESWFGKSWNNLNIVATFNLIYNAALLVEEGIGTLIGIDRLLNVTEHETLCFRQLEPRLESRIDIVWKKHQVFSPAASIFLEKIQKIFGGSNGK